MLAGLAVAIFPVNGKGEPERGQRSQHQSNLGAGLAMLDRYEPLPADAGLLGKLALAEAQLAPAIPNDQTEVQGSADVHDTTFFVVERRQYGSIVERRQAQLLLIGDFFYVVERRYF
jgi:hypothetical protein